VKNAVILITLRKTFVSNNS